MHVNCQSRKHVSFSNVCKDKLYFQRSVSRCKPKAQETKNCLSVEKRIPQLSLPISHCFNLYLPLGTLSKTSKIFYRPGKTSVKGNGNEAEEKYCVRSDMIYFAFMVELIKEFPCLM